MLKRAILNLLIVIILGIHVTADRSSDPLRFLNPNRGDISRIAFVDINGKNLLFRGSNPIINSEEFAINMLTEKMRESAQENNVNFPDEFYLISISLLSLERSAINIEKAFFRNNPERGELINIPVFGIIPETENKILKGLEAAVEYFVDIKGISLQQDAQAISTIRQQLIRNDKSIPIIVYVHCNAGCDRTGEVIAGYRLQFKENFSLAQAAQMNNQECGRTQAPHNLQAMKRYCLKNLGGGNDMCQLLVSN